MTDTEDHTMSDTSEDQPLSEINENKKISARKERQQISDANEYRRLLDKNDGQMSKERENVEALTSGDDTRGQSNEDSNDVSMFASVWVKVEVMGDEAEYEDPLPEKAMTRKSKRKKTRPQRVLKTLQCEECDYTTIYKNCLQIHMLGHTNFKPFSCESCDYVTKYPMSLQRHILTQHGTTAEKEKELAVYNCEQCPYTSYYKCNLKSHIRKHKVDKEFKCASCPYMTSYRHNFIKHSKVHTKVPKVKEPQRYKCDKCPFVTKFEGHITRHLAKIHNEVSDKANRCDMCDFSTKVRWRLNVHKQRSRQPEVMKCNYCDFETYYRCESKKHKVSHYSEIYVPKNPLPCPTDFQENPTDHTIYNIPMPAGDMATPTGDVLSHGGDFTRQVGDIVRHVGDVRQAGEVGDPRNETTSQAGEASQMVYKRTNNYKIDPISEVDWNNIQVSESSNKEKPFKCIMCQYSARFKASVQRHFQRHHTGSQNRPYKCVNCDFSTKTKDQISLHNKRSQSDVEIFCQTCNFSTHYKCQYVMHQKCHYEHKCSVCSYTCRTKYDITKHYAIVHLGQGIKCRYCDYKAFRVESLQNHETTHTGQKPFKCSYCSYKSVRKSLLVNHVKRYHSQVKIEPTVISDSKIQSLKMTPEELASQNAALADYFGLSSGIDLNSAGSV